MEAELNRLFLIYEGIFPIFGRDHAFFDCTNRHPSEKIPSAARLVINAQSKIMIMRCTHLAQVTRLHLLSARPYLSVSSLPKLL